MSLVSPCPGVPVPRCPGRCSPSCRSRAGPGSASPGLLPAVPRSRRAGEAALPALLDLVGRCLQGPARRRVPLKRGCHGRVQANLKAVTCRKLKNTEENNILLLAGFCCLNGFGKQYSVDSDTGSLRLAGVWMLQVDTCQDPTDTCQDLICSACQFKIIAFVAQHCSNDASSFRDFSFLSPVPQRCV